MPDAGDQFKITDRGERRRRIASDVQMIVGVDPDDKKTPRFLPIGPNGVQIDTQGGGLSLPHYDDAVLTYYGVTNNLHQVTLKLEGATVATLVITYAGGGAADNDKLIRLQRI